MNTARLRLRGKVSRRHGVTPDDTRGVKLALRDVGYYQEPAFGITPYPDEPLFEGIANFQKDFDLQKDGLMAPGGETERKLNEIIDLQERSTRTGSSSEPPSPALPTVGSPPGAKDGTSPSNPPGENRQQHAALPAVVPVIVYHVAVFFGMTISAAYAWWISLSPEEKETIEEHIKNYSRDDGTQSPSDAQCDELYEMDGNTCRQIKKRRGEAAARRCWATAADRYAACLKGRSLDELPPLDVWNN